MKQAATSVNDEDVQTFDQIVEVLQKNGGRINIESFTPGDTPLLRAVVHHRPRLAAVLLRRGADPNLSSLYSCPVDILTLAVRQGYVGLAKLLIRSGLDLNRVRIDSQMDELKEWLAHCKSSPLPLLDSSRLVIRRSLGECVTFKIKESNLPDHFKRLILLEEAIH